MLLLNTVLTVERGRPNSHRGKGWEQFTEAVIRLVAARLEPVGFLLWGRQAQKKAALIDSRHIVLLAAHPSPFSAQGFLGQKPFSNVNVQMHAVGRNAIDWGLDE